MKKLDHRKLYRLPWSVTDNVISWLEPTKECNIYCDGCYSANAKGSHKSLAQVRSDLDVFERFRQTDAVSVAGGDPLVHPEIVEVVRMIASRGLKPVVNTNGHGLTPSLLRDMKAAGLAGFTFHVDSLQTRPGWKGATELELNELRQEYADQVAEVGGISCAFNSTVYEKTLPFAPDILEWARRNADKVHVVVFIAFRAAIQEQFDYFAGEERVEVKGLTYTRAAPQRTDIDAQEIVDVLRAPLPGVRAGRLPERHRGARLLQVAHDPARGGQGALLRERRPEVRRALPGLEPPREGAVPGLRAPLDPRQRPQPARALGPRPRHPEDRRGLGAGGGPEPVAGGAPAPPPVGHDHPAGGRPPRRAAVDVRLLPGHDRARGAARLVLPAGGAAQVRGADAAAPRRRPAGKPRMHPPRAPRKPARA